MKPAWKMPCVWIVAAMHVLGGAIHAGLIPPHYVPVATWALVELGAVGAIFFPGLGLVRREPGEVEK